MPRFFIDEKPKGEEIIITGEDAHHITKVLRMKIGEELVICDCQGNDYNCEIESLQKDAVCCKIIEITESVGEAKADVTLFMALPKGDKMDFIVQKAVELGAKKIVPYTAKRSVSRPDEKSMRKKCDRWRKIAKEAAMQSGRGIIPEVCNVLTHKDAVKQASEYQFALFLYENEQETGIKSVLSQKEISSAALMIGPEGGFDDSEVKLAIDANMQSVSLGKRILRCETAPLVALSIVMYESGNI